MRSPNGSGCPAAARTAPQRVSGAPLAYSTRSITSCTYCGIRPAGMACGPPGTFWQHTPAATIGTGAAPSSSHSRKYSW